MQGQKDTGSGSRGLGDRQSTSQEQSQASPSEEIWTLHLAYPETQEGGLPGPALLNPPGGKEQGFFGEPQDP